MPFFRLIVRGEWSPTRDDYRGFFTNRAIKARNLNVAAEEVVKVVAAEWASAPSLPNGSAGLRLAVLDGWRVSWVNTWRRASAGHIFFVTDEEESDAASLEAQAAHAPRDAAIWCIATAPGSAKSEFRALD